MGRTSNCCCAIHMKEIHQTAAFRASPFSMRLLFVLLICSVSYVESNKKGVPMLLPTGPFFPVSGTKFEVKCIASGDSKAPDVSFRDPTDSNKPLANSADGRLVITTTKTNVTTTAVFTWNPIYITDSEKLPEVQCRNKDTKYSASFSIAVIPEESVPTVSISTSSSVTLKMGSNRTIFCEISAETSKIVDRVSVMWKIGSLTSKESFPSNVFPNITMANSSYAKSALSITKATMDNERTYFCIAHLRINKQDELVRQYYASVNVEVTHDSGTKSSKQEEVEVVGNSVRFDCQAFGIPIPTAVWSKNDAVITGDSDERYVFTGDKKNNDADNRFFSVKNITFSDRALFKCFASFYDRNVTKEYRLRVRDPLGALWPFIGMVIEAIILVIIIAGYQACKRHSAIQKEKASLAEDGGNNAKVHSSETSPLVKAPSRTSYTGGDGGAHQRSSKEVSA